MSYIVHTSYIAKMGSGEDQWKVSFFMNEIPHQTTVKTEQVCNQANRVSRVNDKPSSEGPTLRS